MRYDVLDLYQDEEHPFKPTEDLADDERAMCVELVALRLEDAYKRAKRERHVTLDTWAKRCNVSRETIIRRRKAPDKMARSEAEATCELFGVTVDYLRGDTHYEKSTTEALSTTELCRLYDGLSQRHKELISDLATELRHAEAASRFMREVMGNMESR